MRICKIWDADYPWDVRVEKVCHSLQQKHQVHLLCRNTKRQPTYEERDGIVIHRLPVLPTVFGRLNTVIGFPAFFSPFWLLAIWRTIRESKAELIIVRDLPLALTAIVAGRWFRIPVVFDMAENYPAMIQDLWDITGFNLVNFFVRNPKIVGWIEKLSLRLVDHTIVVVEESRNRLIEQGVAPRAISAVLNTPRIDRLYQETRRPPATLTRRADELILIYLGLLERPRGLETAIRAVDEAKKVLPRVRLMILGAGRDEEEFKQLVVQLYLSRHVQFLGWIDNREAMDYIAFSDIGLVPHHATGSWNSTIPNKLFDYMALGKPVIVSNAVPTKRIVTEEQCGIVFQEQDFKGLARAIVRMADPTLREELGRRGRESVATKYHWSVDEGRLLAAIEAVTSSRRSR